MQEMVIAPGDSSTTLSRPAGSSCSGCALTALNPASSRAGEYTSVYGTCAMAGPHFRAWWNLVARILLHSWHQQAWSLEANLYSMQSVFHAENNISLPTSQCKRSASGWSVMTYSGPAQPPTSRSAAADVHSNRRLHCGCRQTYATAPAAACSCCTRRAAADAFSLA